MHINSYNFCTYRYSCVDGHSLEKCAQCIYSADCQAIQCSNQSLLLIFLED